MHDLHHALDLGIFSQCSQFKLQVILLQDESNKLCPDEFIGMRPIPGICTKFVECFKVIILPLMISCGITVNDSVSCCRVGVEFESGPHRVKVETLKMVPAAGMCGMCH